ncbi:hypothetical protein [Streptomyces sp. NPDC002580]|uniref:hypothetical protein n=1 Tax=Streptomyces sp. NPDC002580 TaxID=3364653 RepID=UPI0036759F18
MTKLRTTTHHAPLPVLRAVVFALVGTVLGASAHHLIAGGAMPWWQTASAAVAFFGVGLVVTRRPRSLAAVVAVCGAAQAGLHQLLMAEHSEGLAHRAMAPHMRHAMDAHSAGHGQAHDSPAMTAVHAVATVLVAVLLHRADTVCWSLARGLTTAVDAARARIATACVLLTGRHEEPRNRLPKVVRAWLDRQPLRGASLADVVVRRGPPGAGLAHAN